MKRSFRPLGIAILACAHACACATRSTDARAADGAPTPLADRVRRGIVLVEQHGAPVAIGTILGRDGRVLTALSGLGGAVDADLRYADGSLAHARVGRSDRASDLALLVPQSASSTDGLDASDADPNGVELRAMAPSGGGRTAATAATVRGDVAAHGQRGQPTVRMLDVGASAPSMPGAPLLDSLGRVVAVLVRACKVIPTFAPVPAAAPGEQLPLPPPPCVPEPLGVPVGAIRSFLAGSAFPEVPRLGLRGEREVQGAVHGVRVVAVATSGPAERAGLRPDRDVIVAVDGRPADAPEKLAQLLDGCAPGTTVKLLVLGDAAFREVAVHLPGGRPASF